MKGDPNTTAFNKKKGYLVCTAICAFSHLQNDYFLYSCAVSTVGNVGYIHHTCSIQ